MSWLPEMIQERLVIVLAHFVWQGVAVAAMLAALVALLNLKRPSVRYASSLAAFLLMSACPFVTWFVAPDFGVRGVSPALDQSHDQRSTVAEFSEPEGVSPRTTHERKVRGLTPSGSPESDEFNARLSDNRSNQANSHSLGNSTTASSWLDTLRPFEPWIIGVWLCGVGLLSLRLLLGAIGLWRWRRAVELLPESLAPIIERLCAALSMAQPRVRVCRRVAEAVAIGLFKPMILLPAAWLAELPPDMLEAVLAHELAHVRRLDLWVNLLQRLIETLLFYHPAVWWLSRRLRIERELCCDDLAATVTNDRIRYAETLEHVARLTQACARRGAPDPAFSVAMSGREGVLLHRVRQLLGVTAPPRSGSGWLAGLLTLGLVLTIALGTFVSSRAEIETPASERDTNLRAGRGSPDSVPAPTAGLSNSDEDTNQPNNANGDLRSNPAAGSGDPRRAQVSDGVDDLGLFAEAIRKAVPNDWVVERNGLGISIDRRVRIHGKHFREMPDVSLYFSKFDFDAGDERLGASRLGGVHAIVRDDFQSLWPDIRKRILELLPKGQPAETKPAVQKQPGTPVEGRIVFEDGSAVTGATIDATKPVSETGEYQVEVEPNWDRIFIDLLQVKGWPTAKSWPREKGHKLEFLNVWIGDDGGPKLRRDIRLDRTQFRTVKLLWKGDATDARIMVDSYPSGEWLTIGAASNPKKKPPTLRVGREIEVKLQPGESITLPDVAPGDGALSLTILSSKQHLVWRLHGDERDEQLEYDPRGTGAVEFRITGQHEDPRKCSISLDLSRIMPRAVYGLRTSWLYNPSDAYRPEFDPQSDSYRIQNLQPGKYQVSLFVDLHSDSLVPFTVRSGETTKINVPINDARKARGRAGRGSPDPALDPTAGLQKPDEETNKTNNANGDLRSNSAAGSGDPRRALGDKPLDAQALHGEVLSVDAKRGVAVISLGEGDTVKKLMKFEVRAKAPVNGQAGEPVVKATVEVIRVEQDTSEVRILKEHVANKIAKGDDVVPVAEKPVSLLAPGRFTGANQLMLIAADGSIYYADKHGICHMTLFDDERLKIAFHNENQIWIERTLPLVAGANAQTLAKWSAEIEGHTYQVTAMPVSPSGCMFRLEKRLNGKLVHGSQQFFATAIKLTKGTLTDGRPAPLPVPRDQREWRVDQNGTGVIAGRYSGAKQVMQIADDGTVTFSDQPPVICHLEVLEDDRLKATFLDKDGKPNEVTLPLATKANQRRASWSAEIDGYTLRATAVPYSSDAYVFRLEKLLNGKLIEGSQEFYAINQKLRKATPEELGASPK